MKFTYEEWQKQCNLTIGGDSNMQHALWVWMQHKERQMQHKEVTYHAADGTGPGYYTCNSCGQLVDPHDVH